MSTSEIKRHAFRAPISIKIDMSLLIYIYTFDKLLLLWENHYNFMGFGDVGSERDVRDSEIIGP